MYGPYVPYKSSISCNRSLHSSFHSAGRSRTRLFAGTGMLQLRPTSATPQTPPLSGQSNKSRPTGILPKWGRRYVILNDLSPFATFLSRCFNSDLATSAFEREAHELLKCSRERFDWVYKALARRLISLRRSTTGCGRMSSLCECWREVNFWEPEAPRRRPGSLPCSVRCPKYDLNSRAVFGQQRPLSLMIFFAGPSSRTKRAWSCWTTVFKDNPTRSSLTV